MFEHRPALLSFFAPAFVMDALIIQLAGSTACPTIVLRTPLVEKGPDLDHVRQRHPIRSVQVKALVVACLAEELVEGVLKITPGKIPQTIMPIKTYDDHRMAMAFSPIAMLNNIKIEDIQST